MTKSAKDGIQGRVHQESTEGRIFVSNAAISRSVIEVVTSAEAIDDNGHDKRSTARRLPNCQFNNGKELGIASPRPKNSFKQHTNA